ncbi:peptidoglycan-binding domain-containing protein [Streptomyces sp. NPDC001595]|uniref:peptidoglycan-binding domain-containing protein n=1 Tax=Streptomyces sp. NPDC001532 TaxID=3154520 RepID=UPI00332246AA
MPFSTTRRYAALLLASAALVGGTATGAVAAGTGAQAAAAYPCDVNMSSTGRLTAGYYSGDTVVPSTTQVTAAGKEAQCLLQYQGYNPGTIDGVFGSRSQSAARLFQSTVNGACKAGLAVDGKIGPKSWPYLRRLYC